jgi:hypothetical protein
MKIADTRKKKLKVFTFVGLLVVGALLVASSFQSTALAAGASSSSSRAAISTQASDYVIDQK